MPDVNGRWQARRSRARRSEPARAVVSNREALIELRSLLVDELLRHVRSGSCSAAMAKVIVEFMRDQGISGRTAGIVELERGCAERGLLKTEEM